MADKVKIEIGKYYRLRNRSIVKIDDAFTVSYGTPGQVARKKIPMWRGQLVGHTGERISWDMGGRRSPVKGVVHELDIVAASKKPKGV